MKKIILLCLLFISINSFAQLNYQAVNAVNAAGTYTDLAATGTSITTNFTGGAMTFDDENSSIQNIGFTFNYNGGNFTQFVLNSNGFIKLGAVATASPAIYDALASTETNLISALNLDLAGGTSPEYRVLTSGSAPNRVCTIQFKNVKDYNATASQFSNIDFQIKLYETSNNIEFVYGTLVASPAASTATATVAGVKGSDAASSVNVTKASTAAWSAATFINGNYTGNKHNVRNTVLPTSGQTYRFVAVSLPNNDAQITSLYTLGKLPLVYAGPHVIKVVVRNAGGNAITNRVVTLNITGANTFSDNQTIASLAAGASTTVSFTGYTSSIAGTNSITVSVPADDNNTNNSATTTQLVNGIAFTYADNSAVTGALGFNTGSGIFANKYTVQGTAFVTNVKVYISNFASQPTTGNTVYAVVLNSAGTIVGQSPNYVVLATDLNTFKNFAITTPPSFTSADFYVGLAQTASVAGYYPVGTQAEATPTRSGAYYTAPLAGGVAPTESTANGRFVIEALLSPTSTAAPLTLASFNGKLINTTAQLNWATSTEINTDKFEVEKTSASNISWIKIATMNAAGNSSTIKNYQVTDAGLSNGKWQYRLKMIDKDGSFSYSRIVTLDLNGKAQFTLNQNYPNPVKGSTQLSYQVNADAKIMIELLTSDGRKFATLINQQQSIGSYNLTIDLAPYKLAAGNYVYKMVALDKNNVELFNATRTMTIVK